MVSHHITFGILNRGAGFICNRRELAGKFLTHLPALTSLTLFDLVMFQLSPPLFRGIWSDKGNS
jgi:hypothetical protein